MSVEFQMLILINLAVISVICLSIVLGGFLHDTFWDTHKRFVKSLKRKRRKEHKKELKKGDK